MRRAALRKLRFCPDGQSDHLPSQLLLNPFLRKIKLTFARFLDSQTVAPADAVRLVGLYHLGMPSPVSRRRHPAALSPPVLTPSPTRIYPNLLHHCAFDQADSLNAWTGRRGRRASGLSCRCSSAWAQARQFTPYLSSSTAFCSLPPIFTS